MIFPCLARAVLVATASASTSAIPVPGVGAIVDLAVIFSETRLYRKQFGIPADESKEFKNMNDVLRKKVLNFSCTTVAKMSSEIAADATLKLGAEEVTKYIPIAGTIIASTISFGFTSSYLVRCINALEDVALKIWDGEVARSTNN